VPSDPRMQPTPAVNNIKSIEIRPKSLAVENTATANRISPLLRLDKTWSRSPYQPRL
jgi:hypothetical protein